MSAPPSPTAAGPRAPCPGCGGLFAAGEGVVHPYMLSSAGCWARFGELLAREYSDPALFQTHRLSVDAYAVQHPGGDDRRAVQSVGMHLARLMLQLRDAPGPRVTNDVMLGLGRAKHSFPRLAPPATFPLTVADVPLNAGPGAHIEGVKAWAVSAWQAWGAHHAFIDRWATDALSSR